MVQSSCYRPPGSIPDESSPFWPSQCHPPGSDIGIKYIQIYSNTVR